MDSDYDDQSQGFGCILESVYEFSGPLLIAHLKASVDYTVPAYTCMLAPSFQVSRCWNAYHIFIDI